MSQIYSFNLIVTKIKEHLKDDVLNKNIIMIVGNAINGDSRVIKSANSLIESGFNVLLIGTKPGKKDYTFFYHENIPCLLINSIEFKGAMQADAEEHFKITNIVASRMIKVLKTIRYSTLYTHDFWGLDYGAELICSSYRKSKIFWIHDIHEYVDGYEGILPEGRLAYAQQIERNHIKLPDELIIVNEKIAELIWEKYDLKHVPTQILHNAPRKQIKSDFNLRQKIGLGKDIPLGVYVGRATQPRGLDIIIPALKEIESLHIALLSSGHKGYLETLIEKAKEYNISDRLHIFDYVPDNEVSTAISSANFGISPLTRYGNTDLAIATKILEYIHADLPIIVSNASFQEEFIKENDIGLIHQAECEKEFVDSVKEMIHFNKSRFKITEKLKNNYSWEKQYAKIISRLVYFSDSMELRQRNILHGFGPSAGQPYGLSKSLRKDGISSMSINIVSSNKLSIPSDAIFRTKSIRYSSSLIKWTVDRFDIIHYHFRPILNFINDKNYLNPSFIDFEIFKQMGKKIVFNFRGSEIRINEEFKKVNPYAWNENDDPTYLTMDDKLKKELRCRVRAMADLILVPDPELQTYIPEAQILPRVIDITDYNFVGCLNEYKPLIVHAPTRRGAKGTKRVLSAIVELKEKGFQFDFELIEGLTREETKSKLSRADIVIDQLLIGWYGVLSVEAMSLGKVTLAYLRDDIKDSIPNLPIVNVNVNNITLKLIELIENFELRKEIGVKSREFVESYHSEEAVSSLLKNYYTNLECKMDYSEYYLDNAIENGFKFVGIQKKIKLLENTNKNDKIIYKDNVLGSNSNMLTSTQKLSNKLITYFLKIILNEKKYNKLIMDPKNYFADSNKSSTKILSKFYYFENKK